MRKVGSREMIGWLAAVLLLAIPQMGARAATIVLDFEGLRNLEQVLNFYNGGTGSLGSSGTIYGIGFSNGALAVIDADAGGSGNFANEPSADTIAFFLSGAALTMNVASGFTTGFSFYYTSSVTTSIGVYDGLNGTGNLLASVFLKAQGTAARGCQLPGDPNGTFACWDAAGVNFAGTAKSVNFGGAANQPGRGQRGGEGLEVPRADRGVDDVLGGTRGVSRGSEHGDGGEGRDEDSAILFSFVLCLET